MSIGEFPLAGGRALPGRTFAPLRVLALVCLAMIVLFAVVAAGMAIPVAALCGAVIIAWIVWQWPTPTAISLVVLITLARFISFASFAATHSTWVLRGSQLWKDEVIVVLTLRLVHEAFLRRALPRLHFLDLLVGAFIALAGLYIFYPGTIAGSSYLVRALAFRQDALYLLAYFVGRGLPLRRNDLRLMLRLLIGLSLVISAVALFQFLAPNLSNRIFERLGYSAFTSALGTPFEQQSVRSRDLSVGQLPRASSLFLADLGLAFYLVLLIPLAAALFFSFRRRSSQFWSGLFLLVMVGTMGMTIARAPLAGALAATIALVLLSRSFIKAAWVTVGLVAMLLLFLVVTGYSLGLLGEVFSTQDSSAAAHTGYISSSLRIVWAEPLGEGLGNGSHVSILASGLGQGGLPSWATETWYLQMGLEMGLLAMVLFGAILLIATCNSMLSGLRLTDPWLRALCLGTGGAGVGFILVSAFHPVWAAVQVTFLFWLFAGIAARAPQLQALWAREEAVQAETRRLP